MLRTTKVTVVLLFVAWLVDYLDRNVITFALPAIGEDLGLTHAQQGMIVSAFFVAYASMQLPGGMLADRYGAITLGLIGLTGWSVFTGLTALAWSLSAMLAIRFLFGVLQGVYPSAALKALAERCEPERRATAAAWTNVAQAVGALAAAGVAAIVLPTWGWRVMFVLIAVLGVLVIVAWKLWMPAPLASAATDTPAEQRFTWRVAVPLLRSPALIGFSVILFGYGALVWGTGAWIPSYLQEDRGQSIAQVAILMMPTTLAGVIGLLLGGRLADRLEGRPRTIVVPSMAVTGVLLWCLPHTGSIAMFALVAVAANVAAGIALMSAYAIPLRSLPDSVMGSAMGLIILGSQLAGIITPVVLGKVIDGASYTVAFELLAIPCGIAALAAAAVPQSVPAFRAALRGRIPGDDDVVEPVPVD